jgi:hypothetical protein
MTWVKLDDAFTDHPKLAPLSNRAFRLHVAALCYCARHLTDGYLSAAQARALDRANVAADRASSNGRGHAHGSLPASSVVEGQLRDAGLWEADGDGWRIHDYLRYNPSRRQVVGEREAARDRMARLRSSPERSPEHGNVRQNFTRSSPSPSRPVPKDKDSALARSSPEQPHHIREVLHGQRLRLQVDPSATNDGPPLPDSPPPDLEPPDDDGEA